MKNWKSTLAFFVFVGIYVYSIAVDKPSNIIEIVGYIALYSSIFMMFRSDFTSELLSKLIDNIKIGK
jgi:hypothetical protein